MKRNLRAFADYRFKPRLLPTLATLLVAGLLLRLGSWQLDRAEQKRALLAAREGALQAPSLGLNDFAGDWRALRFRRAEARGRYLAARHLLLDNQIHRGRAGYHVISVFAIDGREPLLLVNRGWVAVGADRARLPDIADLEGARTISGTLDAFPVPGMRLSGGVVVSDGWPLLLLELAEDELVRRLGRPLSPMILKLDPEPGDPYDRDWLWSQEFGPERHLGYAFQWYALTLALLVIYLVVNLRSKAPPGQRENDDNGRDAKR